MTQKYKKRHYSGICVCTHSSEDHHGGMVLNKEYFEATGEGRVAQECEKYGWNEFTDQHCSMYWDKDNPDPDPHAKERPDPPSKEVRSVWQKYQMLKWALEEISEDEFGGYLARSKLVAVAKKALDRDNEILLSKDEI